MAGGTRREARERALELLYESDAKSQTPTETLAASMLAPDPFAASLVLGVEEHRSRLDEVIGRFARGWTLDRMPVIDLALLRMATYELMEAPGTPTAVVISEAVALAKSYSTDDSGRFVNGVLASVADEVRRPERP